MMTALHSGEDARELDRGQRASGWGGMAAAFALLAATAIPVWGQKVYVDFGTVPPQAVPVAPYSAALGLEDGGGLETWSGLAGPDAPGLTDAETGAAVAIALDGAGTVGTFDHVGTAGNDAALLDDFVADPGHVPGDDGVDFIFMGVPAGSYTVTVYTVGGPSVATGAVTSYEVCARAGPNTCGDVVTVTPGAGGWLGEYVPGVTHSQHPGIVIAAGQPLVVNVRVAVGAGAIEVNGIQIVPDSATCTYQGRVTDDGVPVNGMPDMRFRLYRVPAGQTPIREFPLMPTPNPVPVADGLFSTPFNFGGEAFAGGRRWMEVVINGQILSPRQEVTLAPQALFANRVPWSGILGRPRSLPPAGRAGGDLGGSYPNPEIAAGAVNSPELANAAVTTAKISGSGATAVGQALIFNGSSVSWGTPIGTLALPFSGSVASGVAFSISSMSASDVTSFTINNPASAAECLDAQSNGSGHVVEASMTGTGRAGFFQTANAANTTDCVSATSNGAGNTLTATATGSGSAASFSNSSVTNGNPALELSSAGSPTGDLGTLNCVNTGNGRAAYFENDTSGIYTVRVNNTTGGFAAQFLGAVAVVGNFSATGTKAFCIDHPLDPANRILYHYALESPEVLNVYRGTVTLDASGEAAVELPTYFEALNRAFDYQLTPIGAAMPDLHVADEVASNRFRIAGGKAGKRVSWQVMGTRDDAYVQHHGAPVEFEKRPQDRGRYLNPEVFGQPRDLRVADVGPR